MPSSNSSKTSPESAAVARPDPRPDDVAPSRPLDIAFAVVALAFCAAYLILATQIDLRREAGPGQIDARFWPTVLGTTGVGLSVVLLVSALTRPPSPRPGLERVESGGVVRVVSTCALTIGYIAIWSISSVSLLGFRYEVFPIATAALMAALLWLYGHRGWRGLVIYPAATTAFIWVLFGIVLRIPL